MATLKVYPPFVSCLKFSLRTMGIVFVVASLIGAAIRYSKGQPFIGFLLVFQLALFFAGIAVFLGVVLYLLLRFCAWSLEPSGLSGRNIWGRRLRIAWADVAKVAFVTVEGLPALVITSAKAKRGLYAYTLGANIPAIHQYLSIHAGPEHVLTQCFRSAAA